MAVQKLAQMPLAYKNLLRYPCQSQMLSVIFLNVAERPRHNIRAS